MTPGVFHINYLCKIHTRQVLNPD